jgi:hypothetical protein
MKTLSMISWWPSKGRVMFYFVEEDEESIDEQEVEGDIHEEGYQSLKEEKDFPCEYRRKNILMKHTILMSKRSSL